MKNSLKLCMLLVVCFFFLAALPVYSADVRITTGTTGKSYIKVGLKLAAILGLDNGSVMPSKGSMENIDRLMSGEAQIGIAQMDAWAYYVSKHPDASYAIEVMGDLYEECLYAAVKKGGKVSNEDDLQSKGHRVAIDVQGSGTNVTWDYMRQLEPGYANSSVAFIGGTRALGKLAAGAGGDDQRIDAVVWMERPNPESKMVLTVATNKDLEFIDIDDNDLNDKLNGKAIYKFESVPTKSGLFKGKVESICTDTVILARTDLPDDIMERISNAVLNYKESLMP